MDKFEFKRQSKSGALKVYSSIGNVSKKDAQKLVNGFRKELRKKDKTARINVSLKVKHGDVRQDGGTGNDYFWSSLPLADVTDAVRVPLLYYGRIQEITISVARS